METNKNLLSIVVPCYNEEASLPLFIDVIKRQISELDVVTELIFINDGSKDNTIRTLAKIHEENKELVKVIDFSRNFGKEPAMLAGLELSKGDYVVVMDADLQHPPTLLKGMLKAIKEEGYDSAAAFRVNREGEPAIRSFFSRKFYNLMNKISDVKLVSGSTDFRMMTRQVVDELIRMPEYNRFSKGLFEWVGFKTKYIEYENVERAAGETSWSFWGLLKYAIEGFVAFTTVPLRIASILGAIISACAFFYMIVVIFKTIFVGESVKGYPSLMVIILFLSGIQLISVGVIGEYLAKIYTETKKRPRYIIKKIIK